MSLSSFHYFFSLFCFFYIVSLFLSKSCILYPKGYIIFCLSKNPSKTQAKSKQNVKQTSKQNRNRVANVADIILSYTLIGYKFAVSLFASVLLQLLLKQIRKQNVSKRISKSNNTFYTKYASQLVNLPFLSRTWFLNPIFVPSKYS